MITLLSRFFVKEDMNQNEKREVIGTLCGIVGIVLNIILFAFKLLAGLLSGAISIFADAFNNLSDAGSSIITLLGFKIAGKKADEDHPYGHGRMEYIAAFVVAAVIIAMGLSLLKDSVTKIFSPEKIEFGILIAVILGTSVLIKLYMAVYNTMSGRKIGSAVLKSAAKDSLCDAASTTVVLIVALINYFTGTNLDAYAGIVVSLFILYTGFGAVKESVDPLLGVQPEKEYIDRIIKIVTDFDENIIGVHDLMVHDYGPGRRIISLHAEVPANGDILMLHDIIDNLEKKLNDELGCTATIHMDPIETQNPYITELKEKTAAAAKEIYQGITIHDFRGVVGTTHTNLIFDMAVPFSCHLTDKEIKEKMTDLVREKIGSDFEIIVTIDRDNYINR